MLGILLMILKIIGILLLCILGLFLALVLALLFVPIPYHIYVKGDSGGTETFVFWVKIFGLQVFPQKERKKRRKKQDKKQENRGKEIPQEPGDKCRETGEGLRTAGQETDTSQVFDAAQEQSSSDGWTKQKNRKKHKASKDKGKDASDRDVTGMLKMFHAECTDEGNRRALRHLLSEIHYLLRHFGPRRVRADVSFSLGDPANTGYATAALSMWPFSYGKGCRIIPDFEKEQLYLRGWMDARGHVRAVHILVIGLRLLLDRDIRKIIGKILKKSNNK